MSDEFLAAVVEKSRTQAAIGSLRAEGVYDDDRSVFEASGETVAIPVTETPTETQILEVIREEGEPRLRTLADHLREDGWTDDQIAAAPSSWAVLGSVITAEMGDAHDPEAVGEALLAMHGQADTVLARGGIDGQHRKPDVTVVAGEGDTETVHREHGTEYAMDLAEVMFSPGNKAERARMGEAVGAGERVLDMFAGIGYFTLPMARAGAHVTAIERNPDSFQYLLENAMRNGVSDRIEPYRADNRDVLDSYDGEPFDRIVMGYYDASEPCADDSQTGSGQSYEYLSEALSVLAPGGTLHMHEATPESLVPDRPVGRLEEAASAVGRSVEILDVREVKGYSEGVVHVVVDARVE
ncbi:class I SAM-dependent methyltransferase [Salinibaculum rarum]|uniref:class I SAM-dependent methyltransferase n=1 Tax=Salinibaculum rarum TaxID=3058903 RepID=UPI00265FDE54|nr:class I SAM-dependent methyltransferase family protein [Salinibaculum sp. KK48]